MSSWRTKIGADSQRRILLYPEVTIFDDEIAVPRGIIAPIGDLPIDPMHDLVPCNNQQECHDALSYDKRSQRN